jgi:signal peptidase I
VITVKVGNGATITHRVTAVVATDDGPTFQTRGDANGSPDPVYVRADQVLGRVAVHAPWIGFLLAMLSMPSGLAALFSIGATLLTAIWLLDEVEAADEDDELEGLDAEPQPDVRAAPT